jgi:HEPN domain-containing protein
MVDVRKQVSFWREGAIEDWAVAGELIATGHSRHGLFFAHLALEKLLKACIVKQTGDLAPRARIMWFVWPKLHGYPSRKR